MDNHLVRYDPFDVLPDEILLYIMSFFDKTDRFWIFALVSERFFRLFKQERMVINIDDNRDMMRRTNLVLNFKRLSLNMDILFVHLKATKTKIDKLFDSDEASCSHILTINVSNWLKENTKVTEAIRTILDKCQNLKTIY